MNHFLSRISKEQKGFTLIELIVVIAILGILALILTPKLLEALDRSRYRSGMSTASEIQSAMERYSIDYKSYPDMNYLSTYASLKSHLSTYVNFADNDGDNHLNYYGYSTYNTFTPNGGVSGRHRAYTLVFRAGTNGMEFVTVTPNKVFADAYNPPE